MHNIATRCSMTAITVSWSSHLASEHGFISCTGQWCSWLHQERASWERSSSGHSRCWNASVTCHIVWSCPPEPKLHDMFHIGLLKPYRGEAPSGSGALSTIRHGCACLKPAKVVKSRLARGHHEVLVQWMGLSAADASWVDLDEFRKLYPAFQLEDELVIEGGGMSCVCVCVGGGGALIKYL
jgi:hypothetical protein